MQVKWQRGQEKGGVAPGVNQTLPQHWTQELVRKKSILGVQEQHQGLGTEGTYPRYVHTCLEGGASGRQPEFKHCTSDNRTDVGATVQTQLPTESDSPDGHRDGGALLLRFTFQG